MTATPKANAFLATLPKELHALSDAIERAALIPIGAAWDEERKVESCEPARQIAFLLIPQLHEHLESAKIVYLFREDMKDRCRVKLGTAKKASAEVAYLTDYDFILTFNWTAWRTLLPSQRVALVDHELCHCGIDMEKGGYAMVPHDVEEFGSIVRRWGLWKPDLRNFGRDVAEAMGQGDLFKEQVDRLAAKVGDVLLEQVGREMAELEGVEKVTVTTPGKPSLTLERGGNTDV